MRIGSENYGVYEPLNCGFTRVGILNDRCKENLMCDELRLCLNTFHNRLTARNIFATNVCCKKHVLFSAKLVTDVARKIGESTIPI